MNIYLPFTDRKDLRWVHFDDESRVQERQRVKDQQSYISASAVYVTYPSSSQEHQPRHYNSILSNALRATSKETSVTNQGLDSFGDSFSTRDNVRPPIEFRRERKSQLLNGWFFLKKRPIQFHISSNTAIRKDKRNKLSFFSTEINKSLPTQFYIVL